MPTTASISIRTDAAARPGRFRRRVQRDQLHESRFAQARSRQGFPLVLLCRQRHRSLFEQMLLQGQVDSVAVFSATSYMNLVSLKLDPDKDFRWFFYADNGIDLYSNRCCCKARSIPSPCSARPVT